MTKIYKYQETTWINNVKDLLLSCLFFFFFYRDNHLSKITFLELPFF